MNKNTHINIINSNNSMLDLCRPQKKHGIPTRVNNQGTLSSLFTFLCVMQSLILVIMDKYGSPYIVPVPLNPDVLEISKQSARNESARKESARK